MMPMPLRRDAHGLLRPRPRASPTWTRTASSGRCASRTIPASPGQLFPEAKDKELALACVEAYNDWMIEEWCGDSGGRLIPLGLVPLWDPALAAAEVRRNAARGLPGDHVHGAARQPRPAVDPRPGPPLGPTVPGVRRDGHRRSACTSDPVRSMPTHERRRAASASATALTSLNAYMAMADWLLSGRARCDSRTSRSRSPRARSAGCRSSSIGSTSVFTNSGGVVRPRPVAHRAAVEHVPGRVFGCFFDDMVGVDARHQIGIEQLVFETDYPHQDTTWPDTPKLVAEIGERVAPDELELLVRTNAIDDARPRTGRPSTGTPATFAVGAAPRCGYRRMIQPPSTE